MLTQTLKYKQEELYSFLELHFEPQENFTSKILLAFSNPHLNRKCAIFHHYQTGKENSLDSFPKNIFCNQNDYYITANGFKASKKRKYTNLFTLHNIVVDIDCHVYGIPKEDLQKDMDQCERYLKEFFDASVDFPTPNTFVRTGRGFQLWWAIYPLSYKKFKNIYKQTVIHFCEMLKKILNRHFLNFITVDFAASEKASGLFRLPGSFNLKTGKYGSFEILHEDRFDLITYFFAKIAAKKQTSLPYKRKNKYSLADYRERMLYKLLEIRKKEGLLEDGLRDIFCFIYYNIKASEYSDKTAWEAVLKFNNSFAHPLNERKLSSYLSTSRKKNYKFSNKTIIAYLCISNDEQKQLGFFPSQNREELRNEKRKEKEMRNEKIILLAKQGFSQREIAQKTDCSQSTVCRILKKEQINCSSNPTAESVDEEYQRPLQQTEIKTTSKDKEISGDNRKKIEENQELEKNKVAVMYRKKKSGVFAAILVRRKTSLISLIQCKNKDP